MYDATDASTRSSVTFTWVPEVMRGLVDVGAICSWGLLDGTDVYLRSKGILNDLRFLCQHICFHCALSSSEAVGNASRLFVRLAKLWLNVTDLWPNSSVDC